MKALRFTFLLFVLLLIGCQTEQPPVTVPDQEPIVIVSIVPQATVLQPSSTPTAQPTEIPITPSPVPTDTPAPGEAELLRSYIAGMTLEEKIGQLCMFGFSGTKSISSEFKQIMRTYRIGNVILYGQNIDRDNADGGFAQCKKLTDSVRSANESEIPLLISIDLEGGRVTRFEWSKTLRSARSLGTKNDFDRARTQFVYIGEGLKSAGIDVDLGPVLDMTNDSNHFLGDRVISSDPEITTNIGIACIDGLHEAGMLSIVKHFPGHGAVNTDSHEKTPVSSKSLSALEQYDLIPFEKALESGADGVMVAHLLFPDIDDHIASQSFVFITELLRWEYEYEGIVMSDDFRMEGLRKQTSLSEGAVQFILAGGDLILCGANYDYQKAILDGLYTAVEDGRISEERIDESVFRILSAKLRITDWIS